MRSRSSCRRGRASRWSRSDGRSRERKGDIMQSGTGSAASGTTMPPRLSELYDPNGVFEVRSRAVESRHDGARSWLARVYEPVGAGPFPALLEVHGGAWNNND